MGQCKMILHALPFLSIRAIYFVLILFVRNPAATFMEGRERIRNRTNT